MLSYQHSFHAGNLADVHKHSLLAWTLGYLLRKDKPLRYLETHAGRALYDLGDAAAQKTGEAQQGILRCDTWFDADHPYAKVLSDVRKTKGPAAYPGSPLIAQQMLRPGDAMTLAELHPTEHKALKKALPRAHVVRQDGFALMHSTLPPDPRRGLLLVDPSYEIKDDYAAIPKHMAKWTRAWNVGVIMVWYPILTNDAQKKMVARLQAQHEGAFTSEVHFPPARPGHGMIGSGLFAVNPPFGLAEEAARLKTRMDSLKA